MVRKYIGNGQWADVPGTAPTKTTTNLDLDAALEEVATRFLVHLPDSELQSGDRLFFQIEQAHWFYEDFLADADGSSLPHLHLRKFASKLFNSVELLKPLKAHYEELFDEFRAYKGKIPVCGCVLLDPSLTKVVLVQNWAKTSWGLPKGKLNQNEKKSECAKREVGEETGYDVLMDLDENEALELVNQDQHAAMFCVPDVDVAFDFQPRVRKEISNVKFFPLDQLPAKQWGVGQFVPKIKRWVKQYKKKRKGLPIVEDDTPPASPSRPVPPPLSPSQVERSLEASASCDRILKAFDDALAPHLEAARRELEEALVEAEASHSNGHSPETDLEPTPPPRPGGGGWAAPGASTTKRKKKKKKAVTPPPPPPPSRQNDDEEGYA